MSMSMVKQEHLAHFKESAPIIAGVFLVAAACGIMMCLGIVVAILTTTS